MRRALPLLLLAGCAVEPIADDPAKQLSEVGRATYEAVLSSRQATSAIPADQVLTIGNRSGPALLDGAAIFGELANLVRSAETSVDIAMFVWEVDSDASRALMSALENVGPQVKVRLLVNDVALAGGGPSTARALESAITARPINAQVSLAMRPHLAFGAMHEKLAIIDDRIAHLGGANVEAVHDWTDGAQPWRDSAYVVDGEIAASLGVGFDALWESSDLASCHGACVGVRERRAIVAGDVPMIALTRKPAGGPNNHTDSALASGILAAFAAAEHSIAIQTPNLNDDAVRASLIEAIGRGVEVELVLSRDFNETTENAPGQGGGNRENVDRLYAEAMIGFGADHACRYLDARWYAVSGGGVVDGNVAGASHLKYTEVDEQLVIVGSANMDTQSWNYSGESNIAIDDAETARRYSRAIFAPTFALAEPSGHCR